MNHLKSWEHQSFSSKQTNGHGKVYYSWTLSILRTLIFNLLNFDVKIHK